MLKFLEPLIALINEKTKNIQLRWWLNRNYVMMSRFVVLGSVLVTLLLGLVRESGWLQISELSAFDHMIRLRADDNYDQRLLVVGINEKDIQKQKQWPLSDQVLSEVLKKLKQYQPRVIGLDIHRDLPYPPGHEELVEQLKADNVIVITEIGGGNGSSKNVPPPKNIPEERIGFNDFVIDLDNVLRRNLMYAQIKDQKYYSFALQVCLKYLSNERGYNFQVNPTSLIIGNKKFPALKPDSGGYQMNPDESRGWQSLLNYHSRNIAQEISLTQLLDHDTNLSWIKDKIVLIGTTAPSENDIFNTPFSIGQTTDYISAGVIIHAQMVSEILLAVLDQQPLFWFWANVLEYFWIFIWALTAGVLVWQLNNLLLLGSVIALMVLGLWGSSYGVFMASGWIPVIPPAIALLCNGAFVLGQKVIYSNFYDPLTGLPNRRSFIKKLKHSEGSLIAILVLDLTRFRMINYILGQEAGDEILIETARRLKPYVKSHQILARVGADEYAIALPNIEQLADAIDLGEELQKQFVIPFKSRQQDVFLDVSIGIAISEYGKNFQAQELLRDAHIAMYRARVLDKTRPEVFVRMMYTEDLKRWQLENELRQGIKYQEFVVYYQPIICFKKGKISGFEALVRWQSPKRGFISPGDFIPITEETGLIIPLGEWILKEACQQMSDWQEQFPEYQDLVISVNLSSRQFAQKDLVEKIIKTFAQINLDYHSLKLEITESTLIKDLEDSLNILQQLKNLNFNLSLDDFGTGYSSFSYLHRIPLDTLKVDKSFVSLMHEKENYSEIVRTIITLAHSLGLDVVAEGIETQEQMKKLMDWNCEYGQGYLFSKPLSKEDATELLRKNPRW